MTQEATTLLLARHAFLALALTVAVLAAIVFGVAGTVLYGEAWLYLIVFAACAAAITLDVARRHPSLLARRLRAGPFAEPRAAQKLIQSIVSILYLAIFVVAALDHRLGWSQVPPGLAIAADLLVIVGFWIVFRVFRENPFAASVIEVSADQQLVTTGPYAVVRHPMYAGALIMLVATPLALGSWWALGVVTAFVAMIVWRLLDEEKLLVAELPGYVGYQRQVRFRLVPFVW